MKNKIGIGLMLLVAGVVFVGAIVIILKNSVYRKAAHEYKDKQDIDAFFDDLFFTLIKRDPQLAIKLRLAKILGIEPSIQLNEMSPQALLDAMEEKKEKLRCLQTYRYDDLTDQQKISYGVAHWILVHAREHEKFLFHDYKINQLEGVLIDQIEFFTQDYVFENEKDMQNYTLLLSKISCQVKQLMEFLEEQKDKRIFLPHFIIVRLINLLEKLMPLSIEKNTFYKTILTKTRALKTPDKNELLKKSYDIIKNEIYPAYLLLQDYFKNQRALVHANNGVWALPDGDAYYAHMLKEHTTTDLSAQEIHQIGLQEVAKIQSEIRTAFEAVGIVDATKTVGQLLQNLSHQNQFYFPNTDEGKEQCLQEFKNIVKRSHQKLFHVFGLIPTREIEVLPVPQEEEAVMPGGYNIEPTLDGSRPGRFFANLRNMKEMPKYGMETLTIHEADPGHHFQTALQYEQPLPLLRKISSFTAYVEGWALYAEKLAHEYNFYSSFSIVGHLQADLFRAARLVVDTGIHYKRWTREQAIQYMEEITGINHEEVVTEVERYFVLPGQACAYKIGQLKIHELREHAKQTLGTLFDIREFHDAILKVGSVPLSILQEVVDNYIQDKMKYAQDKIASHSFNAHTVNTISKLK